MQNEILLSILILSIPERTRNFLPRVLENLDVQARNKPVEILVFTDNRKRKIGNKRNQLIELANGEYFCFVDDDDRIAPDYIDMILQALATKPDCVVFDAWVTLNGKAGKVCKYGKEFKYENKAEAYYRKPNHLMVHRKDNVESIKFREVNYLEDDEWAGRVFSSIQTQIRINKVLYYYEYSRATSRSNSK